MAVGQEPLLLGIYDIVCPQVTLSPFENKIGGLPDFFPTIVLSRPPLCSMCQQEMVLLLQAYCPLGGSIYHRLLHIFCCPQPVCYNNDSWLVLRSQQREQPSVKISLEPDFKTSNFKIEDWCDDANDWGSGSQTSKIDPSSPTITMVTDTLDQLKLKEPEQSTASYIGRHYPSFYINVQIANDNNKDDILMTRVKELTSQYYQGQNEGRIVSDNGEGYEKATAKHGDHFFQKFKKELSKCPHQLIRYQRGGDPLLITANNLPSLFYCKQCGSVCQFELQLMPQIIFLLQENLKYNSDQTLSPVEFGTVLIYTCQQSCWQEGQTQFIEEYCLIQPDTDQQVIT